MNQGWGPQNYHQHGPQYPQQHYQQPQWQGYRPPQKPTPNYFGLGCAIFIGLFVLLVAFGSRKGGSSSKSKDSSTSEDRGPKRKKLAQEIADIFDGKCRKKQVDSSFREFDGMSCDTSAGRMTYARHKETRAAAKLVGVGVRIDSRELGAGRKLSCGLRVITEGPLDGYVVADDPELSVMTPQYFLPSVGSGFSAEIRECVVAATLR